MNIIASLLMALLGLFKIAESLYFPSKYAAVVLIIGLVYLFLSFKVRKYQHLEFINLIVIFDVIFLYKEHQYINYLASLYILIIALLFFMLKRLKGKTYEKRTLVSAIENDMQIAFQRLKTASRVKISPSFDTRIDRLNRLYILVSSHEKEIVETINQDFQGRSNALTTMSEVLMVAKGAKHIKNSLYAHMTPQWVFTKIPYAFGSNQRIKQPKGVVGIMAPWNYPFQLAMMPVIDALAAGNLVMIKPSEHTPLTANLIKSLVATYFSEDEMVVITGDLDTSKSFASLPFDHLLFTGSTRAGAAVAELAAKNLTPVTLELGGKSPAILDNDADFKTSIASIVHGRLFNTGQTCISPDYLLTEEKNTPAFKDEFIKAVQKQFPDLKSNDYTAILNQRFYARLTHMVDDAKAKGADVIEIDERDALNKIFPPTLIISATDEMLCMQEEIFGPLLPVKTIANIEEAITYINAKDRPLALYYYGKANTQKIINETVSGGVTVNDCIFHMVQDNQPFGGIGASGQGAYHGEAGLKTFSHGKPVFYQSKWNFPQVVYPPYGKRFERILKLLRRV